MQSDVNRVIWKTSHLFCSGRSFQNKPHTDSWCGFTYRETETCSLFGTWVRHNTKLFWPQKQSRWLPKTTQLPGLSLHLYLHWRRKKLQEEVGVLWCSVSSSASRKAPPSSTGTRWFSPLVLRERRENLLRSEARPLSCPVFGREGEQGEASKPQTWKKPLQIVISVSRCDRSTLANASGFCFQAVRVGQ